MKIDVNAAPAKVVRHDLAPGLWIEALPTSGPVDEVARAYALRVIEEAKENPSALTAAGWPADEPANLDDTDTWRGVFRFLQELRRAQLTIRAWGGFEDMDGNPLPVGDAAIRAMAIGASSVFGLFLAHQSGLAQAVAAAKKGLGTAADGTTPTAAVPDTAAAAPTSDTPAPPAA